jgi:DNA-binding winged helix-turn-helix (wHTH) protein
MRLKFGDHVIDVVRRELWHGSTRVVMEPQVFDLLAYLVQNPDRVISRDELLQAIWDGRAISDSAIGNRINGARRAIGDSGGEQRLIRTVPRKGFRFIGQVDELPAEAAASSPGTFFRWRASWALAGSALLGAAIAVVLARPETFSAPHPSFQPPAGAAPSVLVSTLPTKALGAGADGLSLVSITVGDPPLGHGAPPRSAAKATSASTKSNQDVAVSPAPPVLPAAMGPEQKMPVPDIAVATATPIPHVDPFSVGEAKWSTIPCATARIDLGPGATCQAGPPVSTGGHCDIARQVATITNARYQIEAFVKIFDPYKVTATGPQGRDCSVWSGYRNMPDDFKRMNQTTRRGTDWTNFVKGEPQSMASFVDQGRNCIAVERLGPPWHGGYIWVVHASICAAAAGSVQPADIDAALASLQLRTYDAQANLRMPPQ